MPHQDQPPFAAEADDTPLANELPHADAVPLSPERRRAITDIAVAALICLAAIAYWAWDRPTTLAVTPASNASTPAMPASPPASPFSAPDSSKAEANVLNNQGAALYAAQNYTDAEALFRKAIAIDPNGALGFCNLGAVLTSEKHYDEAIAMLQHALQLDPTLKLAQNNLAWALQEKARSK